MPKLIKGLQLLNQADPCVETFVQETGEHVILTAGELHLEVRSDAPHSSFLHQREHSVLLNSCAQRCLRDLRERFAQINVQASPPLVPFRETAILAPDMLPSKSSNGTPRGTMDVMILNGLLTLRLRARPLPSEITSFLSDNARSIRGLYKDRGGKVAPEAEVEETFTSIEGVRTVSTSRFWTAFDEVCSRVGSDWREVLTRVWSFGPRRIGANVLLDMRPSSPRSSVSSLPSYLSYFIIL